MEKVEDAAAKLRIVNAYWLALAVAGEMRWEAGESKSWQTLSKLLGIEIGDEKGGGDE